MPTSIYNHFLDKRNMKEIMLRLEAAKIDRVQGLAIGDYKSPISVIKAQIKDFSGTSGGVIATIINSLFRG